MMRKSRWLERLMHADKERAERRATEDFAAYWWDGSAVRENAVRDVSSTGVFVYMSDPWPMGKTVWMMLQRRGPLELMPERRMTAQTKVMRPLADGAGCMFVSAGRPEERVWEELVEHAAAVTGVPDMAGYVKTMAAVAFLRKVCPDRAVVELLRDQISSLRLKRAIEILRAAADQVQAEAESRDLRVPGSLVLRIIDAGTNREDWRVGARWSTLLARGCTADGRHESIEPVIRAMSGLTDGSLAILADASERARQGEMKPGPACGAPVITTLGALMELAGMRETQAQQAVQQLADLELLEPGERAMVFDQNARVDVTPSALGLWTHAASSRHRGTAEEFYRQTA